MADHYNCFMCHWWNGKRNPSHSGECRALKACMDVSRSTMGHQSCALFKDYRAPQVESKK